MLTVRQRRNFYRLIPFGVIWLVSAAIFLLVEWISYGGTFPTTDTAIAPDVGILIFALLFMAGLGLLVGYVELHFFTRLFSRSTFLRKSVYKFLIYLLFIHVVILIAFPLAASMELDATPFSPEVREKLWQYLHSLVHLNTLVQLGVTISLSIMYAQVSEVVGHATLLHHLAGTYHRPREETRIYLFLDMRSSTTIAEALGHERYFHLLRSYYADLAPAIEQYGGEVYLYVGDEVIVSWKLLDGLQHSACVRCVLAMQRHLQRRAPWYRTNYGLAPTFKAGLHCGKVTTGEIGVIKKHLMFTGDVLNATARIQALCSTFDTDLLVSAPLAKRLRPGPDYRSRSIGRQLLRGRTKPLELFAVTPTDDTAQQKTSANRKAPGTGVRQDVQPPSG